MVEEPDHHHQRSSLEAHAVAENHVQGLEEQLLNEGLNMVKRPENHVQVRANEASEPPRPAQHGQLTSATPWRRSQGADDCEQWTREEGLIQLTDCGFLDGRHAVTITIHD